MSERGRSNMLDVITGACFVAVVAWLLRPPARDPARALEDRFYAAFGRAYLRGDD